ncbi:MAG TPA: hypothetical protein VGO01_09990 [Bradyrhizobium sp.]|jgi:hypothetical protein|nr:hypothetical protein [Bradyrhizobium sp.]
MSASILLLHVKTTGHVLAAATVAAPLDGEVKPEMLAGQALPVRHNGDPSASVFTGPVVTIPASELSILSVDTAVVSIAAARATFIELEKNTPHPLLFTATRKPTVHASNANSITIRFRPDAMTKTTVWVHVDPINPASASLPVLLQKVSAEVTPPNTTVDIDVVLALNILPPGDYGVLALIPGYVPLLQKITI